MTAAPQQPAARPTAPTGLDAIALSVATLGPVGRMPFAPGTWGSAAALIIAPWCFLPLSFLARLGVLAVILGVGALAASRAGRVLGDEDPGCVVVDELLGQWTAFLPFHISTAASGWFSGWTNTTPWELLALFGLFRLFDILKPWPIRAVERGVRGGLGVMLDDVVAGAFAAAAFFLIRLFV